MAHNVIDQFSANVILYTPWNHQKAQRFPEIFMKPECLLMFSSGIEREYGPKCNRYFGYQMPEWKIYVCKVPYVTYFLPGNGSIPTPVRGKAFFKSRCNQKYSCSFIGKWIASFSTKWFSLSHFWVSTWFKMENKTLRRTL